MRKSILLIFCSLALSISAQRNLVDLGIEGGGGLTTLRGNPVLDNYHTGGLGYSGGLFVQVNFPKILSLRTGAYLERMHSRFQIPVNELIQFPELPFGGFGFSLGDFTGNTTLQFINVPLLVRATFGSQVRYFLQAGPYMGFLMEATERVDPYLFIPGTTFDSSSN